MIFTFFLSFLTTKNVAGWTIQVPAYFPKFIGNRYNSPASQLPHPNNFASNTYIGSPTNTLFHSEAMVGKGTQTFSQLNGSFLDQETTLAEKISMDRMDALAKIVVAFAPEGRQVKMEDIEYLQVISMDENHLDIEVEVCEVDGCVSMLIPVMFPSPCNSGEDEECLIDNIEELQDSAGGLVIKRRLEAEEENDYNSSLEGLFDPKACATEYPSWWIFPGQREDIVLECETIRTLLNSADFRQEVSELTSYGISLERDYEDAEDVKGDFEVMAAVVQSVGPAGLYIVARIQDQAGQSIIEVPLQFPKSVNESSEIRTSVLGILASIHV